ncbi:formimidoylglutamate deiminase [Robertkochia solimangrovi]|uniref:formimidoylglutamate deiminase n=1 Tax=Robertkochia solimangrovi TaxID=2213046 RepID=UPI00117C3860|nr:formimidoylglutamate deiminase [Robertkochia solimangrovi]TRZ43756.1 formimidoylglutamate deiminase [Robertkochia solimangrovi]
MKAQKELYFKGLLQKEGWLENVRVDLDDEGKILNICPDIKHDTASGFAIPGFQNAHSHAFQYAMAGLAEYHRTGAAADDFWSWRTAMYDLALSISPEELESIATMLYAEMLRHGYTSVAEFHYLHHDPDGKPYSDLSEMGSRLIAAAKKTGIRITLVPMFYQTGGFGLPPTEKQRRFLSSSPDDYFKLLEATEKATTSYEGASSGIGLHSLRAGSTDAIKEICRTYKKDRPFHIHLSEQLKEIEDCFAYYGKRPVAWFSEQVALDSNFHLVHATHLDDSELKTIAGSGANVVICPSTEGNLGDGLFRFREYMDLKGNWSIGTDSHVGLNPLEELRILDYGQRLISHKRNTFVTPESGDSGLNAITMAWESGRTAMGASIESFFKKGEPFDAVVMKSESPLITTASTKYLCNTFLYSADVSDMEGTIVNGNWKVKSGNLPEQDNIQAYFKDTLLKLGTRK